jgi:Predicted dehydrogenases and related proteins
MVSLSPVSIALIGCGAWGANHARVFSALPESKLVAVADGDPKQLRKLGVLYPGLRLETDYRRLLEDEAIEALVIATPTHTHYRIVKEALEAGKHILCEKPLCKTEAESQELADLAEKESKTLMVGHTFLFNPGLNKIRELVVNNELGQFRYLSSIRTNLGPIRSDVNAAYDLATHDIAIFNWLLNAEPEMVSAIGASFLQPGVEDVVLISMRYPGNILASIHASWLDPKKVRQITVVGSRKMATWNDLELTTPVAIYEKGVDVQNTANDYGEFLRMAMWDGDVRLPKIQLEEPLRVQARYFLNAVRQGLQLERSGPQFSVGVVRVLEAIAKSIAAHGQPVAILNERMLTSVS